MLTRRPTLAGFATASAVAVVLAVGCAKQNPPKPATSVSSDPRAEHSPVALDAVPPQFPDENEIAPNAALDGTSPSAQVLAKRAAEYSREIGSLLAQPRNSHTPSAEPSQVRWIDPNEFRLGDVAPRSAAVTIQYEPPAAADDVTVEAAIETAPPQANRTASIDAAPARDDELDAGDSTAATAAANTPASDDGIRGATAPAPPSAAMSISGAGVLGEKLAVRARDYPRDVATQLEHQLLLLLLDEQVPQLNSLAGLPTEDRELISAVLDGITLFRSTLRQDNNMLLSRKIKPLIAMADRLRSQAELAIPTVTLCRSVVGFGNYDPVEPARFAAGQEHKAIIYCEIANFASNLSAEGKWETQLKQDLVLYTESGVPVWSDRTETIRDQSRRRRYDFFVNKRITIPGNLTIGRYLLKVTIVDEQANRVAEASIPIVIAAQ